MQCKELVNKLQCLGFLFHLSHRKPESYKQTAFPGHSCLNHSPQMSSCSSKRSTSWTVQTIPAFMHCQWMWSSVISGLRKEYTKDIIRCLKLNLTNSDLLKASCSHSNCILVHCHSSGWCFWLVLCWHRGIKWWKIHLVFSQASNFLRGALRHVNQTQTPLSIKGDTLIWRTNTNLKPQ